MRQQDFGFINPELLLGGAHVPWLTDGTLAKLSILGVNLWLGFPTCSSSAALPLQSLPGDVEGPRRSIDASGLRTVWSSKAAPRAVHRPLLIASFAFNFNNFRSSIMLTDGG